MASTALSPWTVSLGGTKLSVVANTSSDDPGYQGSYEAQESTSQFVRRDVPKVMSSFRRGAGYVRRTGEQDDDTEGEQYGTHGAHTR